MLIKYKLYSAASSNDLQWAGAWMC